MTGSEQRAAEILASIPPWLWDGETIPVPIETIADSTFGLLVRDVEHMESAPGAPPVDEGGSISGLLLAGRREIWVNAEEAQRWPPRRRFTIAHELGHWLLHRDPSSPDSVFCRTPSVDPDEPEAGTAPAAVLDPIEEEANEFAAALLLPTELIRRHYEDCASNEDRFTELCSRFGSSSKAMSRRLRAVI